MRAVVAVALALSLTVLAPASRAVEEADAFARVVVDGADVRSGPGVSFRVIETAGRGATFPLEGRSGPGFWLRVRTADGRVGYVLGDEVQSFAVREDASDAPSRPGWFAPPPLAGARGGLAILGGILLTPTVDGSRQASGYLEVRPSIVVHETVTLEAFVGDSPSADGSQIVYGAAVQIHLAPRWPVCPYVGLGGGGLSVFPNGDSFVLRREDLYVARAGGGILFALRGRILVRLDASNVTLFAADTQRNGQTYAGGLGVYF